jgi:hypothetical protein
MTPASAKVKRQNAAFGTPGNRKQRRSLGPPLITIERNVKMKRTILSLLVAGLFAGIGTSAMAQDAAAKKQDEAAQSGASGTDSNAQQPGEPADPSTKAPQAKSDEGAAGKKAEGDATNAPQAKSEDGAAGKKAEGDATNAPQAKSEDGAAGKPVESGATAAPSEEYTAALKACDNLTGNYKSKCVDEAKKKHGQM